MGAFSGLKDAKRGFATNPLRPGKYIVRIDTCDWIPETAKGDFWKNTLTVLAVIDGDHKVGEVVHTMFKAKPGAEGKTIFQQNLKSFLCGVLDVENEAIGEAEATQAHSADSPMKGLVTIVTGVSRSSKTKKDEKTGDPFEYTVYSWSASLDDAEIREALGDSYATFFPNG